MNQLWVRTYKGKPSYVFEQIYCVNEKRRVKFTSLSGKKLLCGKVIYILDYYFTSGQQGLEVGHEIYSDSDFSKKISVAEFIALKMTGEFYETSVSG